MLDSSSEREGQEGTDEKALERYGIIIIVLKIIITFVISQI